MTDRFEEAVRQAARDISTSHPQPTYHDAWERGRRRRLFKRGALGVAGAALAVAAISLGAGDLGGPQSFETDDVAIEADAEAAPTDTPRAAAPTATSVAPTITQAPGEEPADVAASGVAPEPQETATSVPQETAPLVPLPTSTVVPAPPTAAPEPAAPASTATPAPPPTVAPQPDPTVAPEPTSDPAATGLAPDPTPTAFEYSVAPTPVPAITDPEPTVSPQPSDTADPSAQDDPTTTAAPDDTDETGDTADPGETGEVGDTGQTPAPPTTSLPAPADEEPNSVIDETGVDPSAPADAVIRSSPSSTNPAECDSSGDGIPDALCEILEPYACLNQAEAVPGYTAVDTTADGQIDTCVALDNSSCDTNGDLLADVPCIIAELPVEGSGDG